jgi:heat shock protein HslJ
MKKKYLMSVVCIFAMFAACTTTKVGDTSADAKSKTKPETSGITTLEWRLVSVVAGNGLLTTENVQKQSTLKIEADGRVHGHAGCNSFSGESTINGTTIEFDELMVTQMACLDMKIETAFLDALKNSDSFVIESGELKLKRNGEVIATFSTFR